MQLSITTDYRADIGNPEPYLRRISDAGFTHVHWCHHWNTDFIYSAAEIEQIGNWLKELGMGLLDLHGSHGKEKCWFSAREYERKAGVEMTRNRIDMTARLGGGVVIMHVPEDPKNEALRRSLDELQGFARERGVRVAVENGKMDALRRLLSDYPPDFLGLCYDCGHGNMAEDALDDLRLMKDRLISVHLHDNDGIKDLHKPPFSGTVQWPALARIIAESSYRKCMSFEVGMKNAGYENETEFLDHVFRTGARFSRMVEEERSNQI